MAVVSSLIKSPRLQPHLNSDIEELVGMVWFSRTSSGWGSSDRYGASSAVISFSSSSGRIWSS
jgi:hypothetical protein